MRRLMWFAVGFAAACVIGVYIFSGLWLLLPALLFILFGAALLFWKPVGAKIAAWVLFGCAIGFGWLVCHDQMYLADAKAVDGQTVQLRVCISDHSRELNYGITADGEVTLKGKIYRVRIYLNDALTLAPGDVVEGKFSLRYTAAGGAQESTYHPGKGIFLLAYSKDTPVVTRCDQTPARFFPADLRRSIIELLNAVFPEDALGFARALLLGDSSLLTYEIDTAFQTSGIRHVIAVSGLHVSILFALVYLLSGKRRFLTALLGIPALLLFAAVAGFTPSITRACIMQGLMILALLLNKEYDPPTALGFAVLVMLVANPLTITSVSFQLSVGCMIGIFLFSGRISGYLLDEKRLGRIKAKTVKGRLVRWLVGSASVTLGAMAVTTPLCAWYFGCVSLIGMITNLLTLWVVSFIFYGIMAACILGAIWLPIGKVVAVCIAWPIRYVLTVAKVLGTLPFAAIYTRSIYTILWLIVCYVLLAVFLLCKEKRPRLFTCCVIVTLLLSMFASWAEPQMDNYRMTVLDVGQGQCILLQSGNKRYLVDCGGDSDTGAADAAAELLLSQGVNTLDGLILTHYDSDHAGGVMPLLSRIRVKTMYLPDIADDGIVRNTLTKVYEDKICWVRSNTVIGSDQMKLSLIPGKEHDDENESGMCILFQTENCDILITGDRNSTGERELLEQAEIPELEILIAGHHGSKSSTGFELLYATSPETVAISVGADNRYGHPAREMLNRLKLFGCEVRRTDKEGTILFRG